MSPQRPKKDASFKDFLWKHPTKKGGQYLAGPLPASLAEPPSNTEDPLTEEPVTHTFLEILFGMFREDIAAFKREMALDVQDIKKHLGNMGQQVDSVERIGDQREEELNTHCRKLL
ncbi:hypothetical protein NDU88_003656 [Pleurodeles waltl]|uniref:Uncharacterized protein n=1 Tax=Pleurodeles waltl TaxID=8319 RepID=A0AAV7KXK1_PLEWA|nr:hypothetical protein NDU88_003656 [Pleurodeles waltl]